jgi:hypothetical protein
LGAGARYSLNRNAALRFEASRGERNISGSAIGTPFDETRGMFTLQLQI